MKRITTLAFLVAGLVAIAVPSTVNAAGNVDFFAGQRELDKNFGSGNNIEEQDAVALMTDFGKDTWPVHIAFDLISGRKDRDDDTLDIHLDGSTGEVDLGGRWYPAKGSRWMPHLGAGLGLMSGKVEDNSGNVNSLSFDDSKLGYWTDGGIGYRFGEHFKLGARVHYAKAKLDQKGDNLDEIDAGGLTYGVNAGITW